MPRSLFWECARDLVVSERFRETHSPLEGDLPREFGDLTTSSPEATVRTQMIPFRRVSFKKKNKLHLTIVHFNNESNTHFVEIQVPSRHRERWEPPFHQLPGFHLGVFHRVHPRPLPQVLPERSLAGLHPNGSAVCAAFISPPHHVVGGADTGVPPCFTGEATGAQRGEEDPRSPSQ